MVSHSNTPGQSVGERGAAEPAEQGDAAAGRTELATVLRDLAWTIQRVVPEAAGLDPLTNTELAVIKQVQASPGVTVSALARHLGMKQSNVSAAVRDLVERGLVVRESNPSDRRVHELFPTEKSLADKDSIEAVWSGAVQTAMTRLDPEQVAVIENASDALRSLDEVLHAEQLDRRSSG